ncbi:CHASE2 domain-containing protein [Candidatus Symbiobacter mobilis]|uniref:Adenylate cyclase n=1 Tax=Candidatus Symbiobacter mobilis CR TaxID=946483 RepID=U5NE08_9BURK|nr:adenylate/guanylate cyclase domain-containing protein [Candidatus Symbiobacter mobilis]AGX88453.1 adenylate cyclase [Candidatus Symbiobacter mobilis CR]
MEKSGFLSQHGTRSALSLVLIVSVVMAVLGWLPTDILVRLENYAYDVRLRAMMPGGIDPRIVIVDIDEASLQKEGHWPWQRTKIARMIDVLFDHYQIDVLGFDVLFAERDESSGWKHLEHLRNTALREHQEFGTELERIRPTLMFDDIFAKSLRNRRVVLGYYFRHDGEPNSTVGELPPPALKQGSFVPGNVGAVRATGYSANLPELQRAAASGGYFNASPLVDPDGVFRRIALLQMYDGKLYETLSLAMLRLVMNEPKIELVYEGNTPSAVALEYLRVGKRKIPVDADLAALVPYRGKQGSFVYVTASDVLHAKVPEAVLRGAIVLVGTSAPGLLDLRTTPVQESYAGVELHANMIAGMLDGAIKHRPPLILGVEIVLLTVVGVTLAFTLPMLNPLMATLVTTLSMLAIMLVNLYAWKAHDVILPVATGIVLVGSLFVFNMTYGYFVDSRGKRLLAKLFGQYVPPELVNEMALDPTTYSLEGASKRLTVLFSDVRGFTTISEGLDPKQLTLLMNEYLTPMTHVIHHHRGTIDKYMGDAIMAFWGAPVPDEHHARHALLAAIEMIRTLDTLQDHFREQGWPPIKIGVGLNTGDMVVGNMGSEFRLAYTVMGDAVNLGSRLEGLTKQYGVQIIVSEFTKEEVGDFAFRELDSVRVKGKDQPVRIYEPIGPTDQLTPEEQHELKLSRQALQFYRSQDWARATLAFLDLQRRYPDRKLYALYLDRCAHYEKSPPPADWDGAFTFDHK